MILWPGTIESFCVYRKILAVCGLTKDIGSAIG